MTPVELVDGFITWITRNRGRSERTGEIYRLALELLIEFLAGRDPREATDDDLVLFTGLWLHKRNVTPRGRVPYVAGVRGFYKWMMVYHHATRNPAAAIDYPGIGKPLPRAMMLPILEKLMWAPDLNTFEGVRDAAVLSILAGGGLRVSGLINLNVSSVTEQPVLGRRRVFLNVIEKGSKERIVPLPQEAQLQLAVYMDHPALKEIDRALPDGDQVLFVSTRNRRCPPEKYIGARRRLTRGAVWKMVQKYGTRQGLPPDQLHPHALRHLFGTELAEEEVPFDMRQDLMGHEDPESTRIYTRLAMRQRVAAVDKGPLAKIRTPTSDLLRSMQGKPKTEPSKR